MGANNVANSGIVHARLDGQNYIILCGNSRAHMAVTQDKFRGLDADCKCKRCAAKVAKRDANKAKKEAGL